MWIFHVEPQISIVKGKYRLPSIVLDGSIEIKVGTLIQTFRGYEYVYRVISNSMVETERAITDVPILRDHGLMEYNTYETKLEDGLLILQQIGKNETRRVHVSEIRKLEDLIEDAKK